MIVEHDHDHGGMTRMAEEIKRSLNGVEERLAELWRSL